MRPRILIYSDGACSPNPGDGGLQLRDSRTRG